jgi:probable HAF family extracellular repeat protein
MQDIGAGSQFSWTDARAVSADGQRVAGAYQLGSTAAFSWTPQGGIVALAGLTTGAFARAQAISGDGLTVVGLGVQGTASTTVRWAGAGVPESLGIFPGVANSQATATNSDASVIVGFGLSSSNRALAYRWTPGHGMRDLGTIGGGSNNSAMAWGVSEDGFVIVGNHDTNPPLPTWGTFFWTPVLGMRDLWTFLQSTGADPSGWLGFDAAYAVSADGRRIVGTGAYTGATGRERAWMATLPAWATCYANCDGSSQAPALSSSDFTCFLQHYAAGDPYANCDGSTVAPVINTSDLTCFLRKYAAGCN